MNRKRNHIIVFLAGFLCLTWFDQWTKHLAAGALVGNGPIVVWDGVFEFLYSENRGAAFGILQGRQGFFFAVAIAVFGFVAYAMAKLPAKKRYVPMEVCLVMVMAGAAGNLIDRVFHGYVVDFLYFKLIDFPIFNVADCYVTVGTALLLVLFLWYYSDEEFDMLLRRRGEEA
ncbi:MAG: signal peptidase II [Hungatella sp.]|nr:signal peptidase II [Hungatella sp.]